MNRFIMLISLFFFTSNAHAQFEWTKVCAEGVCPIILNIESPTEVYIWTQNKNFITSLKEQGIEIPPNVTIMVRSAEVMHDAELAIDSKASADDALTPYDGKVVWACTWKGAACWAVLNAVDSKLTWAVMAGTCTEALESCSSVRDRWKLRETEQRTLEEQKASGTGSDPETVTDVGGDPLHPTLGKDPNHPDFGTGRKGGKVTGTETSDTGRVVPIELTPVKPPQAEPDKIEEPE